MDGTKPIRITLVWTDRPGDINTPYVAKNNLDLFAFQSPCFPCWSGNRFNASTGYSSSGISSEAANTVEQIIIPPNFYPSGSILNIQVTGQNIMFDGIDPDGTTAQQDFAVFVENAR